MVYVPLSQRDAPSDDYNGPFEGLPSWLDAAVREFLECSLSIYPEEVLRSVSELRRSPYPLQEPVDDAKEAAISYALSDSAFALDLIDYLLGRQKGRSLNRFTKSLSISLDNAGSVWMVTDRPDEKGKMLARREAVDTAELIEQMRPASEKVSDLLAAARSHCYGRAQDPSAAYEKVVHALEAAMHEIVTPKDAMATLGKMTAALRDAPPGRFTLVLSGKAEGLSDAAEVVLPMTELIWATQRRHGTDRRDPVTLEEARAAYTASVSICGLFLSGAVIKSRKDLSGQT